jgi:hypothetical protein
LFERDGLKGEEFVLVRRERITAQISGEEDMHVLGRVTRGEEKLTNFQQLASSHAGLFAHLTMSAIFGWFSRLEGSGGQLEQYFTGSVTVLADEEDASIFIQREQSNSADVFDDIQVHGMLVREAHLVTAHIESAAAVDGFVGKGFEGHTFP